VLLELCSYRSLCGTLSTPNYLALVRVLGTAVLHMSTVWQASGACDALAHSWMVNLTVPATFADSTRH
jgi:hypothetical protein